MAVNFDGTKLLQTIVLNERRVAEFYRAVAYEMNDGKGKHLFEIMATDEEKHEKIYTNIMNKLPNGGNLELSVEDAEYMNLLIETNMFEDTDDTLEKFRGRYAKADALELAEKIERDGIMFINELQNLFPDVAPKEISLVLAEEKKHLKSVLLRKMDIASSSLML